MDSTMGGYGKKDAQQKNSNLIEKASSTPIGGDGGDNVDGKDGTIDTVGEGDNQT